MPVLQIDLLPVHFAQRRAIKTMFLISVVVLLAVVALWAVWFLKLKGDVSAWEAKKTEADKRAAVVKKIESETNKINSEAKSVTPKVEFIEKTKNVGDEFWDRFHEINKYISDSVQISNFSLTPTSVSFTATTDTTRNAARFILNLRRCPILSNIQFSGIPAGEAIQGVAGTAARGGMGMGGMPGEMMGMPGEAGMAAEAGGAGMPPEMAGASGMMGGMPGAASTATGAGGELITLSVSAQLQNPITIPVPGGGAARPAAAGMGMSMGMPGEMGMGMPGQTSMVPEAAPPAPGAAP